MTIELDDSSIAAPLTGNIAPVRTAVKRTVLMCKPDYFTVVYRINPWMDPAIPTDTSLAVAQWQTLYDTYVGLGFDVRVPVEINEGEGDFLLVGDVILAGTGFRSASNSHEEVSAIYGRPVITLNLVNPSFYHLDTAIAVLDDTNIAYLPSAFDEPSLAVLRERYPDAIIVTEEDAAILGLNSYSDGYNVVIAARAKDFERQLRERGYNPIGVDLSELLLGGGGVKCCTLELRR